MKNFPRKLPSGQQSKSTEAAIFKPTEDDIATSIKTLNDPKVRAAFSQDWSAMWSHFIADDNSNIWWEARCSRTEPNYCLPTEFIKTLSMKEVAAHGEARHRSGRMTRVMSKRALISEDDAKAEAAFREICRRFSPSCVGEWNGRPVIHELLGPFTSYDAFPDDMLIATKALTGTLEQRKATLRQLNPTGARIQRILRHRAGQLFGETKFVRELRRLRLAWADQRTTIPFPLTRHAIDQVSEEQSKDSILPTTTVFFNLVREFLNCWELTSLCTWDLITPLGPIDGLPVKVSLNALGDIFISSVYPSYWPATTKKEGIVARLQSPTSAGMEPIQERIVDKPSIFERAYEMRVVELAFRARYTPAPHGYVERLNQAYQNRFDVTKLRISQIREMYIPNLP